MKQTATTSYVKAVRGKRDCRIYISDIKRIYKLDKRALPMVPYFQGIAKCLPFTDSEENSGEM